MSSNADAAAAAPDLSGNRLVRRFAALRERGGRGVMPFLCGGHPSPDATAGLILAADRAGALAIEIGVPFSDPIADGPVIAAAMHDALTAGCTPASLFEQVRSVRGEVEAALLAMVSVSLVEGLGGADAFCARAAEAGFDGCIFPDAPLEEAGALLAAAGAHGMTGTLLVAPTTPAARAAEIARACTGFVYLLARSGITGERQEAPDVARPVEALRAASDVPVACGFGISTAAHVRAVVEYADAAIVGSALVRRLNGADDPAAETEAFVRALVSGLPEPAGA